MIYDKLLIALLTTQSAEKEGSVNAVIADYILTHLDEMQDTGIKELAEKCHVGTGSVSRFCRDIGLENFAQLKDMIRDADFTFQTVQGNIISSYESNMKDCLSMTMSSVDENSIRELCADIRRYKKIASFGLLKAETAAINLQTDMNMLGRHVHTAVAYTDQMEYITGASENTLIILFSYTGTYFNSVRKISPGAHRPRIWMICAEGSKRPEYVNRMLTFRSSGDQLSHPYQLMYISSLITQYYAQMIQ